MAEIRQLVLGIISPIAAREFRQHRRGGWRVLCHFRARPGTGSSLDYTQLIYLSLYKTRNRKPIKMTDLALQWGLWHFFFLFFSFIIADWEGKERWLHFAFTRRGGVRMYTEHSTMSIREKEHVHLMWVSRRFWVCQGAEWRVLCVADASYLHDEKWMGLMIPY